MTNDGKHPSPSPPGALPADGVDILGVRYRHYRTPDGGDLYVTRDGLGWAELLMPMNWYEGDWFRENRERLEGSGTVYRIATRSVGGRRRDLVVKWCRVGEEVPFDTVTLHRFSEAEFNSPYEEFALVRELRSPRRGPAVRTHRPLAIYVPAKRLRPWQTGRVESKIARKKAKHRDVELDIFRQYILVYEWIKGVSIVEALEQTRIPRTAHAEIVADMTRRATADLACRGFRVLDMKPAHIIVRPRPDGDLLREPDGRIAYALVDFELLERTPEHEQAVSRARRGAYLRRQRDRFGSAAVFPPHLRPMRVQEVDYVHGATESTGGELWVVGRDPRLFDYFQPERWRRTPRRNLSESNEVYYTKTKDDIHLVWRVSRVGEWPDAGPADPSVARRRAHGFNSPFEEFACALRLSAAGVPTVYPRAIYMSGLESDRPEYVQDPRRYEQMADIRSADGQPVLRRNRIYITIWGFWNGRDEMLARHDADYCRGLNLDQAVAAGYVSRAESENLLEWQRARMAAVGFEDLHFKPDHLLLSLSAEGILLRDTSGRPEIRLCNFEFMAPVSPATAPPPAEQQAGGAGPAEMRA